MTTKSYQFRGHEFTAEGAEGAKGERVVRVRYRAGTPVDQIGYPLWSIQQDFGYLTAEGAGAVDDGDGWITETWMPLDLPAREKVEIVIDRASLDTPRTLYGLRLAKNKRRVMRGFPNREPVTFGSAREAREWAEAGYFEVVGHTPVHPHAGLPARVGDGVTIRVGSDSYGATVSHVTPRSISVQRDTARQIGEYFGGQEWIHERNHNAIAEEFTPRKTRDGQVRWVEKGAATGDGRWLSFGGRRSYRDPSF